MSNDVKAQLADYFAYVDKAQGAVDVSQVLKPEPIRLKPIETAPSRQQHPWRPVWMVPAAALVTVALIGGAALLSGRDRDAAPVVTQLPSPAEEFDYPLSEIPPFRAEVRYTLDPDQYAADAAETVRVAVSYGGEGLFRVDLVEGIPRKRLLPGYASVAAGSFTVLGGTVRGEYQAGEDLFIWSDVVEGGFIWSDVVEGGLDELLEPISWEPWDDLCDFGVREVLPADRVAGRDTTRLRCSYGDDSYELSVDTETGVVLRASGGEVPVPDVGEVCLCALGFEVLSVEYEPEFADDHFELTPPPGAEVEDYRGTVETILNLHGLDRSQHGPQVGEPAPPLLGVKAPGNRIEPPPSMTLDGEVFDLGDLRGSRVVLYFWASWLNPENITRAFDELEAIAAAHPDVAIVTVLVGDDPERARPILAAQGVEFPTIQFPDVDPISDPWHIGGLPLLVLLDRDGTVVHSEPGYDSIGPAYRGLIRDLGW